MANRSGVGVSLIVATLGRTEELGRLLESLRAQTYTNIEILVVDQNTDDRVARVLSDVGQGLNVKHVRSARGLSRARNVGLGLSVGEIVGFPDDDCWYEPSLLGRLVSVFDNCPSLAGVVGRCVDRNGRSPARYGTRAGPLGRFNVWTRGTPSPSIFLRRRALEHVGSFDEQLGVGADSPYQSGEETDLLVRLLRGRAEIRCDPKLRINHEDYVHTFDANTCRRARAYGRGLGRVLKKNGYPSWFAVYVISRPVVASLLSLGKLDLRKAEYYLNSFAGRVTGWLGGWHIFAS